MTKPTSDYKAGFVTVVGHPNVGKSTLMNILLGQKIAAISSRPQMTRRRQLGILTTPQAQIIFIDTPGVHKSKTKLGEYMNEEARLTLADADVIVFIVDASQPPTEEDAMLAAMIAEIKPAHPVILALNKVDKTTPTSLAENQEAFLALAPNAVPLQVSALNGYNRDHLLAELIARLPTGQPYYDEEQVTDLYEKEIAADLIREAVLLHLRDEVPHAVAVRIDEYTERGETGAYIQATLFVERESHKPILIGQGGEMLKKIGSSARQEIEGMSGRKVFLELRVKVEKNWRNNPDALNRFGYTKEGRD